jgi:hypothetical protein
MGSPEFASILVMQRIRRTREGAIGNLDGPADQDKPAQIDKRGGRASVELGTLFQASAGLWCGGVARVRDRLRLTRGYHVRRGLSI